MDEVTEVSAVEERGGVESSSERGGVESPPVSGVPLKEEEVIEARARMNELARELRRIWTREGMRAYLELRRQWG